MSPRDAKDPKDPIAARVGHNIRRHREAQGLSQRELAKLLQSTGSNEVSKYERGVQLPRTHTLLDISEALRVSIDDLLNPPPEEGRKRRPRRRGEDAA